MARRPAPVRAAAMAVPPVAAPADRLALARAGRDHQAGAAGPPTR